MEEVIVYILGLLKMLRIVLCVGGVLCMVDLLNGWNLVNVLDYVELVLKIE